MISALLELSYASRDRAVSFDCSTCSERVKKLRRCREERENFTEEDDPFWPMQIEKGGDLYGFCPAKATWNPANVELFRLLVITSETGVMISAGGLEDQPSWWIDLLGWFIPQYESQKFSSRVKSVLGDDKSKNKAKGLKGGGNNR